MSLNVAQVPITLFEGPSVLGGASNNYNINLGAAGTFVAHKLCELPASLSMLLIVTNLTAFAGNAIPSFLIYQKENAGNGYNWCGQIDMTRPTTLPFICLTNFIFTAGAPVPSAFSNPQANPGSTFLADTVDGVTYNSMATNQGTVAGATVVALVNPGILLAYNNGAVGNTWSSSIKVVGHLPPN